MSVSELKKEQLIRLRFIDAVFSKHGRFSRVMLTETFGISVITATRDLKIYRELNEDIFYDTSAKVFLATGNFSVVGSLWENALTDRVGFLRAIESLYGVKIGVRHLPTFGVHKV